MDQKKISIIIPAYNVEKYLEQCVKSLFAQSYSNIEIIIVDDGSKDNTGLLADELANQDSRVLVIHQKNAGLPAARNAGLRIASGEMIMFLDADDWLEKDACEVAVEYMQTEQAELVIFEHYKEYSNKRVWHKSLEKSKLIYNKYGNQQFFIYDMRMITAWGKLYSHKILDGIFFDEKMRTAEDVGFNYLVYSVINKAVYIDKPLLHYRILENSAIHGYDTNVEKKFEYPIEKLHGWMSEFGTESSKKAYFSFAAIAYLVICQNGVGLNPQASVVNKIGQIKRISQKECFKELFKNIKSVYIPISRKSLLIMGKLHLYLMILAVITIKNKIEKKR